MIGVHGRRSFFGLASGLLVTTIDGCAPVSRTATAALEDAERLLSRSLAEPARQRLAACAAADLPADPWTTARYLNAVGVALRDTGRSAAALSAFRRLRSLTATMGAGKLSLRATMDMVVCLMNGGDWRQANELLVHSHSGVTTVRDPALRTESMFWSARVLEARGAGAAALRRARHQVVPASEAVEDRELRIARHVFVSRLALNQPVIEWNQAQRSMDRAWELVDPSTCVLRRGQVLTTQALFDLRRGARSQAEARLDEAEAVFATAGIITPHYVRLRRALRTTRLNGPLAETVRRIQRERSATSA